MADVIEVCEDGVPTLEEWLGALPIEDREAIETNPADLPDEFTSWAGTYAWMHARLAALETALAKAELETKRVRAAKYIDILKSNGKRPGVEEIKAMITIEPDVQDAEQSEIDARRRYTRHRGLVEAMRGKKDMVVQMGARERAEMDRDPAIRDRNVER